VATANRVSLFIEAHVVIIAVTNQSVKQKKTKKQKTKNTVPAIRSTAITAISTL
jgi:hypothetical protein